MTDVNDQYLSPVEQAMAWVIKLDGGELAPTERWQLKSWLESNAEHRSAFRQARNLWLSLDDFSEDVLSGSGNVEVSESLRQAITACNPLHSADHNQKQEPHTIPVVNRRVLDRVRAWYEPWLRSNAVAASLVMGLLGFALWLLMPLPDGRYQTGTGEQLSQVLADGSVVTLNTNSSIDVDYTENSRIIYLRSGEAFFAVASDRQRPFIVKAGDGQVKAIGTAFNVHKKRDRVSVMVTEGTVEVSSHEEALSKPFLASRQDPEIAASVAQAENVRQISANQSIYYRDNLSLVTERKSQEVENALAWRTGKLHVDNTTLENFVAELNRYSSNHIVVMDTELKQTRIGGIFSIQEPLAALKTLEAAFDIETVKVTPYFTLVYQREAETF